MFIRTRKPVSALTMLSRGSRHNNCAHAASKGHNHIMIRTVDTDVVVPAIASYFEFAVEEWWLAFGTRTNSNT